MSDYDLGSSMTTGISRMPTAAILSCADDSGIARTSPPGISRDDDSANSARPEQSVPGGCVHNKDDRAVRSRIVETRRLRRYTYDARLRAEYGVPAGVIVNAVP